MDLSTDYLKLVKEKETAHRYAHTLGVIDESVKLATKYGANKDKARIAASLHDITKNMPFDQQREMIRRVFGDEILKDITEPIYHSYSAYVYAKEELKIDDEEILNAILCHTIGKPNMSLLDKIIFIADFIEPSRDYYEAELARSIAYKNIDDALVYIMEINITLNEKAGKHVPKLSYEALDYYKRRS